MAAFTGVQKVAIEGAVAYDVAEVALYAVREYFRLMGEDGPAHPRVTMQVGLLMAAVLLTFPDASAEQISTTVCDLNSRMAAYAAEPLPGGKTH